MAGHLNPVEDVVRQVRAILIEDWVWPTILSGLWVLLGMTALLLAITAWQYRRATT